ncbi:hypothetical protein [Streptococcus equi]|uniref:Hypothetical phage protein n=1 Tax=Streptococcus equi subsp. equi (strain 4047) TaxID=553482 RepID=C0M6Y5_STRE4|nr:hypothetical protein [Streptococcus equi]QBX24183.1 hypothetical protein Javan178_0058 [Streptococcus phage Javan178]HEL0220463.1 hypothetical protein [Streptococcus equi subsp. zooepidemicus]CAW92210.1 hypothetical phage protein [Streptococcus equi subsp. equi 4047]CRR08320.1 phage protein [Streptococcus equi subsp. equi]CRS37547.1 phage protein [Streptococcus equi subsp. equi]
MNKEQLIKTIKETDYNFYAVRGWDEGYKIGEVLPESVKWDYERDMPTDIEVGGTCTTIPDSQHSDFKDYYETEEEMIEAIEKAVKINKSNYCYSKLYLVGSYNRNPYNAYEADENEAILADAVVLMEL